MNVKKLLALTMTVLLMAALFAGCGAASKEAVTESMDFFAENGSASGGATAPEMEMGRTESLSGSTQKTDTVTPQNQKLIRKIWLEAETEDMDTLLSSVEARLTELGGYVENREVRNGSKYSGYTHRYASLTIRIPADKLDGFVTDVSEQANIVSNRESADDITLSYAATESRMKMLETEQERLLELLAAAKDMKEILQIEERLMDVRTELEEVTSQLRVMDNQVNYGTVYLDIDEVREYTVVEEEPEGFFARIGNGFMKSLKNMFNFCKEFVIFLIVAIPYLIPFAVIIVAIILIIKLSIRRSKKRRQKQQKPPFPTKENEQ